MKRFIACLSLAVLLFAVPVFADSTHDTTVTGGTTTITNTNTATGGAGGAGGAGGSASVSNTFNPTNVNAQSQSLSNSIHNSNTQGQTQGQAQRQRQSQGQTQGQGQNNDQTIAPYQGQDVTFKDVVQDRIAPTVVAPSLTAAGTGVCLGSVSIGLSGPMAGASFGITKVDKGCEQRSGAALLYNMGYAQAALRVLMGESVKDALAAEGQLPVSKYSKAARIEAPSAPVSSVFESESIRSVEIQSN